MLPSAAMNGGGTRGTKKPGTPKVTAEAALRKLNSGRIGSSDAGGMNDARAEMRSQNSRNRSTPRRRITCDQRRVDRPDRHAGNPVGCESDFGQACVHARLVCAERAATLQHEDCVIELAHIYKHLRR
jgi:hypothetical protein